MDVDEAGRDQQPGGVDLAPTTADVAADRRDPLAIDRNIGDPACFASAVDDRAAADYEIMHEASPIFLLRNDATTRRTGPFL